MKSPQIALESEHSISRYISGLREGDQDAAQVVWERFIKRLVELANRKLGGTPRSLHDGEDVVQQAFSEFFLQVQQGRFPKLRDRDDLWQVLATLVDRRAIDQIRKRNSLRAGGGKVITAACIGGSTQQEHDPMLQFPSGAPSVEEAMEFVDALRERLGLLRNDEQRKVALLKLRGYSNREIADEIGSSLRTVERTLGKIRSLWENVWGDL